MDTSIITYIALVSYVLCKIYYDNARTVYSFELYLSSFFFFISLLKALANTDKMIP